jgi:hypothetical protein
MRKRKKGKGPWAKRESSADSYYAPASPVQKEREKVAKICPFSTSDFLGLFDDDDSDGYAEDDDPDDATNGASQWRQSSNDAMCEQWMHVANSANWPSSNIFHINDYNQQLNKLQTPTDVLYGATEENNDGLRIDNANRPTRSSTTAMFEPWLYVANLTNSPSSKFHINKNPQLHQHQIDIDDSDGYAEDDDPDDATNGASQLRQSSNDVMCEQWMYVANSTNLPSSNIFHINDYNQQLNKHQTPTTMGYRLTTLTVLQYQALLQCLNISCM